MNKKFWLVGLTCLIFLFGCGHKSNLDVNRASKNLNTYSMEITYSDHALDGKETLTYINQTETILDKLYFHLYPKAFTLGAVNKPVSKLNENKAYPNGFSEGDITINKILVNGKESLYCFEGADNNILNVALGFNLEPMESVKVKIEFKVLVPNINHRFGYGANTVNLANFYPIVAVNEKGEFICDPYNSNGDPFYSDCANYNVKLVVPSTYKVASTGVKNKIVENENLTSYEISAKAVRDFAIVLSEKFETISDEIDGVKVNYYFYDDDNVEASLKAGVDAIKTFNNLFGKYPYPELNIVKSNFVHGGMEYPNLIYISDEVKGLDYINTIIHETAHQWWYGVIGSNAFRTAWLDEGLTEYSTALFYEENPEYNIDYYELIKSTNNSYVTFVDLYKEILGSIDTSMNRPVDKYNTEPEYVYMTYVKGMLLFDNLREVIGKEAFIDGLKQYYNDNAFKNVTPDNLIAAMEKASKRELKSYINSWVEGNVVIINMQ